MVVLCLSGHRSLPGTRWLRARGYEAYSLQGGILAWKKAGYELNPSAGRRSRGLVMVGQDELGVADDVNGIAAQADQDDQKA